MKHFFHDQNPWKDKVVYLPDLQELSACLNPDYPSKYYNNWVFVHDLKVDAYIIPQSYGFHECGIRFGPNDADYSSPFINHYIAQLLLDKYRQ